VSRVRVFSKRFAVPAQAIDVQGHVNNLAYVGWMQDVAIEHSAAVGWPMRRYLELGAGWVVRSHFIEYLRPAFADERLGAHKTLDLIYTARLMSGTEAVQSGLFSREMPADELHGRTLEAAERAAAGATEAFLASKALIGMVKIQAHRRFIVTPQRTADNLFVAPTPIIEPVMVCVVLTGIPRCSVIYKVAAPALSALTPSSGVTFVILVPIVLTIFHPPLIVPNAIAVKLAIGTQML